MYTETQREYQARYRAKYPNRLRVAAAEYRSANPGKYKEAKRAWYLKNKDADPKAQKERNRRSALKRAYGITPEEWDAMFEAQGKACAACKRPEHRGKGWHTDHCHATGKVRGILCNHCNLLLGYAADDPMILLQNVEYLKQHLPQR
jgi:hypothetical protein